MLWKASREKSLYRRQPRSSSDVKGFLLFAVRIYSFYRHFTCSFVHPISQTFQEIFEGASFLGLGFPCFHRLCLSPGWRLLRCAQALQIPRNTSWWRRNYKSTSLQYQLLVLQNAREMQRWKFVEQTLSHMF